MSERLTFTNCTLCHRGCHVDRSREIGYCQMSSSLMLARAALHFWEEPCISGLNGSGTVFFSGCSLRCVYCQNHSIALGHSGKQVDSQRLTEIFLSLMEQGANNINLVTPTHYLPVILPAIDSAKAQGLSIPIVYNTGNYETLDTLKALEGYVDVYLPDFKYWSAEASLRYSNAPDYRQIAMENIAEMYRQVGSPLFIPEKKPACGHAQSGEWESRAADVNEDEGGLMTRGMIVRHLLLPGWLEDAKQIVAYLYETYGNSVYLSLMNQYTPLAAHLTNYPEMNQKVSTDDYDALIDFSIDLGVENAFIQEGETASESFIPDFDNVGV